ncbi:MAG: adenylyltransferase/cytidyltransferase family protein [Lachnospiraceae bacterium]|nr:adenylyltransferase/cytidyltransferase family protein [Lachnospiraceae bacterium]
MGKIDDKVYVEEFLMQVYNVKPLYDDQRFLQIKYILSNNKDLRIVTKNFLLKKVCDFLGKQAYAYNDIIDYSKRMLAFRDGLKYLALKKVPVFFYHRVDEMREFKYSDAAVRRKKEKITFPKIYQDIDKYKGDLRELFGEKNTREYINEIGKIPQVVKLGNCYCHENYKSKYVNVVDGLRVTKFQPIDASRKLHIYGRCGVFGYAVEDEDCFPSQLQKYIVDSGEKNIKVINHGLWGGEDEMIDHNFLFELQGFDTGDIVLFYRFHFDQNIIKWLQGYGLCYKEVTEEWHKYSEANWCFYDKPGHMNSVGYKNLAEIIGKDLLANKFSVENNTSSVDGVSYLCEYIEENEDVDFEKKINEYINGIIKECPSAINGKNGAIVMNCNPFTYGHRYLIEYAAQKVDWLYIFVVEEDKSYFKYNDRFEMVIAGTNDITNVIVVPSGKFMISSYTFPEYFMKDYVKEKKFDVSNDINIFCKQIAPKLGIKYRFAGEEPFDPVTENYNETMRRILPKYEMHFVEIPRKKLDESRVINATIVRKMISERDEDNIKSYVPETTFRIIQSKYM